MPTPPPDYSIDYVELTVPDAVGAKRFYGAAFGWEFQDWGPDYVSFKDGRMEGGFREVEGPFTPSSGNPLVILYAADLAAAERRIISAGGRITERHEFPGGRRFHFTDPAGNVLGVWTKG
jgi:hypothetical protein